MLEHAADIQERELQSATAILLAVMQPALTLIVGMMVLYIVLAIMLPILKYEPVVVMSCQRSSQKSNCWRSHSGMDRRGRRPDLQNQLRPQTPWSG